MRFGLRGLLIGAAICGVLAIAYRNSPNVLWHSELAQVQVGMSKDEVRQLLGEPLGVLRVESYPDYEGWVYATTLGPTYGRNQPQVNFENGLVTATRYGQ